jgi:hypothetical protein
LTIDLPFRSSLDIVGLTANTTNLTTNFNPTNQVKNANHAFEAEIDDVDARRPRIRWC